jgi:hypothetical protein
VKLEPAISLPGWFQLHNWTVWKGTGYSQDVPPGQSYARASKGVKPH